MLVAVLKNVDTGSNFPIEVRANVCSLIGQAGKNVTSAQQARVKEATEPILKILVEKSRGTTPREGMLGAAAQRVLDGWA